MFESKIIKINDKNAFLLLTLVLLSPVSGVFMKLLSPKIRRHFHRSQLVSWQLPLPIVNELEVVQDMMTPLP